MPHVDLIHNVPCDGSASHLYRDVSIILDRSTDREAYDVQIEPKESTGYSAEFILVVRLSKGHPEEVKARIRFKPENVFVTSVEAICKHDDAPSDAKGLVHIPIIVRYYDRNKNRQFETVHEIVYDDFLGGASAHLVQGVREVPGSRS